MKKLFKNAIFTCFFALCCVFTIFSINLLSVKVNATENENQEEVEEERKELYCLGYKDNINIMVLRLYDNNEYHLLIYDLATKKNSFEDGTYSIMNSYVILVSENGDEKMTTMNEQEQTFTKPTLGKPADPDCKHVEVVIDEKEPTCLEEGNSWGVKCKLCGGILHKPEVLPKIDHTYGEWVLKREATQTLKGLRERYCTICDEKETQEFDYVEPTYKTLGTYKMTLKTTEVATLNLFDNNTCEITINKLDSSIFKIKLNYQVVDTYIVLFSDDMKQEYLIEIDETNKTFAPQLTDGQKNVEYWESLVITLLTSFLGTGGLMGIAKIIIGKWHKKKQEELDARLDQIENDKNNSKEQNELTKEQFKDLKSQFEQVLVCNNQLIDYIKSKIEIDETKAHQTNKLLEALLPNLSNEEEDLKNEE